MKILSWKFSIFLILFGYVSFSSWRVTSKSVFVTYCSVLAFNLSKCSPDKSKIKIETNVYFLSTFSLFKNNYYDIYSEFNSIHCVRRWGQMGHPLRSRLYCKFIYIMYELIYWCNAAILQSTCEKIINIIKYKFINVIIYFQCPYRKVFCL